MGLWGRIKKTAKRAGKAVAKTSKKVGRQVKRSAAVAAPALLGPGLGEKVGISIAGTMKKGKASTLKGMARVSNVTGRVVQIAGTALGTIFAGPIAGAAIYRATALQRQLVQHEVQEAKFKAGMTTTRGHNVVWKKQPLRILEGVAAGVGAAAVGAIAGGTSIFASGSEMVSGIFGSGGTAAAGGETAAMKASTAAMVQGETAAGTAAAAAPAAGSSILSTAATTMGGALVTTAASRLLGGLGGTSTGGVSTGGTEVYTGEGTSGGGYGFTGDLGAAGGVGDMLSGDVAGIPMPLILGAVVILLIWMFWK
jgi:hypothetical protein